MKVLPPLQAILKLEIADEEAIRRNSQLEESPQVIEDAVMDFNKNWSQICKKYKKI